MKVKIEPFSVENEKEVLRLLSEFELPTEDLTINKLQNFLVARREDGSVIGAVGIEAYRDVGLLRSLVVHPNHQVRGLGRLLTNELESFARKRGVKALYLLTTTAADFFLKLGYQVTQRATVPESIERTEEFKSICPASAACLYKYLEST
jgi:amino-acid N-acetyltransferase